MRETAFMTAFSLFSLNNCNNIMGLFKESYGKLGMHSEFYDMPGSVAQ